MVSTPVRDVVRTYGHLQGVHIAHDADGFVRCCELALEQARNGGDWLAEADLAALRDELADDAGAHVGPDRRGAG